VHRVRDQCLHRKAPSAAEATAGAVPRCVSAPG
jgi:hypothetical protein